MNFKKVKLDHLKFEKYHDAKLSISFHDQQTKEYHIHKILFASFFDFFEKLFDHELKTIYTLDIPFEIQIFEIIYDKIYFKKIESNKDLNYYENILYLLCYLQYKDIKNFLNKIIEYIETNYNEKKIDTTSFIENLQKMDLMNHQLKIDFIHRISYDKFIQNHYDEKNKRLILTRHLYFDCFPNEEIEVNGLKFSLYHTEPYDLQQIGFWLDYEIMSSQTTPMIGNGTLFIHSGINVYKHKIKSYRCFKDRHHITFDKNGRCGYIKESVNSIYEKDHINNFITFYKIVIDFD
jgi:hypothetical protein